MGKNKWTDEERRINGIYYGMFRRSLAKNFKVLWSIEEFIVWYKKQPKVCAYCGLTESEIQRFAQLRPSKRNRGVNFEVDRRDGGDYSADNCKLVCYWCNNAKSDVFYHREFDLIAKTIAVVIREIIDNGE